MNMITKGMLLSLSTMAVLGLTGCGGADAEPKPVEQAACTVEGAEAPVWVCMPDVEGSYSDVGSAALSAGGMSFSRRNALASARSSLAQQIETEVKDKVEDFTRGTGIGTDETVDKVSTQVTKQVAKVTLSGSKQMNFWQNPKTNTLYVLVAVPKSTVNESAKEAVKTSYKNDNALWQQFQSKNALEALEKEFPTD